MGDELYHVRVKDKILQLDVNVVQQLNEQNNENMCLLESLVEKL